LKPIISLLAVFCFGFKLHCQSLISSASANFLQANHHITYSVGEPIIQYAKSISKSALIGVQQPLYENMFGEPSLVYSTISANPTQIDANAISTSAITVTLKDSDNETIPWGGEIIEVLASLGSISSVTDNNNGTYSATLTSSQAPGTSTLTYEVNGFLGNNTAEVDFLADCSGVSDDVNIPDGNLGTQIILARKTISTGGKVNSGQEVTLVSGQSISLKPGFTVSPGGLFTARIDLNLARIANCISLTDLPISMDESSDHINQLNLYPNPTSESVTIEFNLENPTSVTISIFDFMGKLIKTIDANTLYGQGAQRKEISVNQFGEGIYTIRVSTENWVESKSLVIIKN
jgi:hypothetical protein